MVSRVRYLLAVVVTANLVSPVVATESEVLGGDSGHSDVVDEEFYDDEFMFDEEPSSMSESESRGATNNSALNMWYLFRDPAQITLKHQLAYGLKHERPLVANRASIRLQWEKGFGGGLFFRADAKSSFDGVYEQSKYQDNETVKQAKQEYQQQNEVREFFLQGSRADYSISVGQQVIVWGKADGAVVTDIISPRNVTESVFTTVEDSRLGQTMIIAHYYEELFNASKSQQQWSFILNPDVRVNQYAMPGHPYYVSPAGIENAIIEQDDPEFSIEHGELGLRWTYTEGKFDIAIMAADVVEDDPVFEWIGITPSFQPVISTFYGRYQMLGGGVNIGVGNFVIKSELAYKNNRHLNTGDMLDITQRSIWDAAAGFDYDASGVFDASVELSHQHVMNWNDSFAGVERNSSTLYGAVGRYYNNDTVRLQYTASLQLQNMQSLHRLETSWDVDDQLAVSIQWDHFSTRSSAPTTSFLTQLEALDRILLQLTYDF
ncbi:hypothetical protein A9Q99_06565 [Gammaproteobacteria bacterium 45_16_T64]|nr:hypothetical protein A9Q99_06565 [Gammaproteobacteria bacterium 45_16_T64]